MIITDVSSILTAKEGDVLRFFQTFSKMDATMEKIFQTFFTIVPLGSQVVTFGDVTKARFVFVKTLRIFSLTDQALPNPVPLHVEVTFDPDSPTPPPAPATQTFLVNDFLHLTTAINAMTITHPNSGPTPEYDAQVEVIIVGDA